MPFDTSPGQVLSSLPSSADKQRSSKIGGCAGVLFQIFHGKRLFPRKSLPAERLKQGSINHTEDKLPIAKLLLIADENVVGFAKEVAESLEVDKTPRGEPCDEKPPSGRTPGVVARLMGLDTMPLSEPACCSKKPYKDMDCQFSTTLARGRGTLLSHTSLYRDKGKELKRDVVGKHVRQQKASKEMANTEVLQANMLSKSPSLPPHHLDCSFPSVVLSSKKGGPMNKRVKRPLHLVAAANKVLDKNMQPEFSFKTPGLPNAKNGSHGVTQSHKGQSGKELVHVDTKDEKLTTVDTKDQKLTTQAYNHREDEHKAQPGSKDMVCRRRSKPAMSTQEHHRHPFGHGVSEELRKGMPVPVKTKQTSQPDFMQPRHAASEKVKVNPLRLEETSRRLSQQATSNSIKTQTSRVSGSAKLQHRSRPKSFQDSSAEGSCSSQASNCVPLSGCGTITSYRVSSYASNRGITSGPAKRLPRSVVNGAPAQSAGGCGHVTATTSRELLGNNMAGLLTAKPSVLQNRSFSAYERGHPNSEEDTSSCSPDGLSSLATCTESLQRSSMESSSSSDPSLSDITSGSHDCSSFFDRVDKTVAERVQEKWESSGGTIAEHKTSLEISSIEDSITSGCRSHSGDYGDTASQWYPRGRRRLAPSYSGKNTAAILQELLMALSSSGSHQASDSKTKDFIAEGTEPCSLEADDFDQAEKLVASRDGPFVEEGEQPTSMSSSKVPHQDSQYSESFGSPQGRQILKTDEYQENQVKDDDATIISDLGGRNTVPAERKEVFDCDALMNTISKLHCIDPEAIGLNARATMHKEEEKSCRLGWSTDLAKQEELAQPLEWGVSNSTCLSAEDDADSICRSEIESCLKSQYEEAAAQNKKLVSDCIREAFSCLSKGLYGLSSSLSGPSSAATHVLTKVYALMDEWKGMAVSMNLDNMVEKEMDEIRKRWHNSGEAEEVAEAVEGTIFDVLMEEVLLELI